MEDTAAKEMSASYVDSDAQGRSLVVPTVISRTQWGTLLTPRHHVPVDKLPPELLTDIFLLIAASSDPFLEKDTYEAGRSWISMTHVCQYWRTLALTLPLLWRTIEIQPWSIGLASICLVRAMKVPLRVTVLETEREPFSEDNLRDVAQLLLPHSERITSFTAELSRPNLSLLASLLTEPAPILASLDLSLSQSNRARAIFVEKLFGEQLPSLRKLSLDRTLLSQLSQLCSQLTVLHISYPPPSFGLNTLTSLLGETSALQSLNLSLFFNDESIIGSEPMQLVHLPCLRTLQLSLHRPVLHYFFLHFVIPSTARMDVEVMGKEDTSTPIFAQSDVVAGTMRSIIRANFIFAEWSKNTPHHQYGIFTEAYEPLACGSFTVEHEWSVAPTEPFNISHVDLTMFNFPNLKALSIDVRSVVVSPTQWASILSALVHLTVLEVKSYDADLHVMQGLALQNPLRDEILCPALAGLCIHGGLCGKDNQDSTLQLALDAFEQRALRGSPIAVVSLVAKASGQLSPEHITRLRRVVPMVEQYVTD